MQDPKSITQQINTLLEGQASRVSPLEQAKNDASAQNSLAALSARTTSTSDKSIYSNFELELPKTEPKHQALEADYQDIKSNSQIESNSQTVSNSQSSEDALALSAQTALKQQSQNFEEALAKDSLEQDPTLNSASSEELAGQMGQAAAAPIVREGNTQALQAAKMAAIKAAEHGQSANLQKAAAVAAAAAAVGNRKINVNISDQVSLQHDAATQDVERVTAELDQSIDKLDLETPQRSLLSITWPIFVDLALYFATLIINTVMVGMVSVKAVAELTIGNQIFDLALIIFNFFNIGVCVVSAQALGANNKRLVRRIIHVGLGINLIMGTIVSIAIFFLSGTIVKVMQVPAEIAESSHRYLQILSISFLPLALCLVGSAILRAYNCTRDAMYVSLIVNVITIGGNSLFLFGYLGVPQMGVEGVAISTVIARTTAVFVFIPLVLIRTKVRIIPRFMFVFSRKVIYSILNIGLPGAGENLSWHTQYMFMTGVVASLGAMELATQGIYFQIIQVLMLFSASIGMGTELLVAHYTGAMRLDLANKQLLRSVKIGEVITVLLTFSMPLGTGAFLIARFTDSPEVLALATPLFLLTVFQEPGRILNVIIINSLRATGDTHFPVIMAVISMWGISVPLGSFLALYMDWGLLGVWIGFTADEWCRGIAMLLRWKSGAWKKAAKRIYENTLRQDNQQRKAVEEHQKKAAQLSA